MGSIFSLQAPLSRLITLYVSQYVASTLASQWKGVKAKKRKNAFEIKKNTKKSVIASFPFSFFFLSFEYGLHVRTYLAVQLPYILHT